MTKTLGSEITRVKHTIFRILTWRPLSFYQQKGTWILLADIVKEH